MVRFVALGLVTIVAGSVSAQLHERSNHRDKLQSKPIIQRPLSWTCECCQNRLSRQSAEILAKHAAQRDRMRRGHDPVTPLGTARQVIYLDFDSGSDGTVNYTQSMRDTIQEQMESHFSRFDVSLTQAEPTGLFMTLVFNQGPPFNGVAEHVDFRNLIKDDFGIINLGNGNSFTEMEAIFLSSFIASHEAGHLMGLQHRDAFGPIGAGVFPGGGGFFNPPFSGPADADETPNHIEGGGSFNPPFFTPKWFAVRAVVKLGIDELGSLTDEQSQPHNSIATAQPIELVNQTFPNTLVEGDRAGLGDFAIPHMVILGEISSAGEQDFYRVSAEAGNLLNLEVFSTTPGGTNPPRYPNVVSRPRIEVFDANGQFVDYYGRDAIDFSFPDAIMQDVILPNDGDYFIKIEANDGTDTGNYELLVHRFLGSVILVDTFDIFRGIFESGDVQALSAADDVDLCLLPGIAGSNEEAPLNLTFDGNTPNPDPSVILFEVESSADAEGLICTVELFNWNASEFEVVDVFDETANSDSSKMLNASDSISDYVSPTGDVRARVSWQNNGLVKVGPWSVCVDKISWTID